MIQEMLDVMKEMLENEEFFKLQAEVTRKAFNAAVAVGFTREEAITLIGKMK